MLDLVIGEVYKKEKKSLWRSQRTHGEENGVMEWWRDEKNGVFKASF